MEKPLPDLSWRKTVLSILLIFVVSYFAAFLNACIARRAWLDANYCNFLKVTPWLHQVCVGKDLPQREAHPMRWPR